MEAQHKWNISRKPLVLGFVFSLLLTLGAYFIAVESTSMTWFLRFVILGIGMVQALIQLIFFLHLGTESKPRWSVMSFLFMVLVAVVLFLGSLWIMYNLDYNMQ